MAIGSLVEVSGFALAMKRPALTQRVVVGCKVPPAVGDNQQQPYHLPLQYRANGHSKRGGSKHSLPSAATALDGGAGSSLCACYAMPGTDLACRATSTTWTSY
eukprot:3477873-Rhodomonas_salina.2